MYRNTTLSNPYNTSYQSNNGRSSLSKTGSAFNQSRSPLYPIGPSITQQQFNPIRRAPSPSPYLTNKQGFKPPSYEQKYLQTSMGFVDRTVGNYQEKQRRLIERNEIEIQEEQKKRQNLRISYQREIQNANKVLMRNMQRKEKLLLEIQSLEKINRDFNEKLSTAAPPKKSVSLYEPLDRKQQDIIITKNKLLTNIRQKQEEYQKEAQEEQQYWQSQLKQKQKILLQNEEQVQLKRLQLRTTKNNVEKPDLIAIQDEVRDSKYKDFIYQAELVEQKIANMIRQRENQQRQVDQALKIKRQNIHTSIISQEQLTRQYTNLKIRAEHLQRVSKEIQAANNNLLSQLQRKEKMIEKYEVDIHSLKQSKQKQEENLQALMNDAREGQYLEMQANINDQMLKVQEQIRYETSISTRLKTQYQKIYEILCSTASKNIHETFNSTLIV